MTLIKAVERTAGMGISGLFWIHCYEHFRLHQIVNQKWVKSIPIRDRASILDRAWILSSHQIKYKTRSRYKLVLLSSSKTSSLCRTPRTLPRRLAHTDTRPRRRGLFTPPRRRRRRRRLARLHRRRTVRYVAPPASSSFPGFLEFTGSRSSSTSRPVPPLVIQAERRRLHCSFAASRRQPPDAASLV
jgi:hypothetical protein